MKFSSSLIVVSFAVLLVSFWNRNELPRSVDYLPDIFEEPRQTATRNRPFSVEYKGVQYRVEPEFEYELYGMVVSYRHHEGTSRMHRRSNDYLNMLDVCVIWGDNAKHPDLGKLNFWNGIFTCNVKTRSTPAWQAFDMFQLSNNHLLSDDDFVRDRVRSIRVGDQIRFKGYLASYSNPGGGKRGTSTTRFDKGDGACETVFVEDFDIVRAATSYWRLAMWASLASLIAGLYFHFRRPYRPYDNN